ncbi:MAG: hypothetical protein KIT33_10950 [Candidatus Kapabacteria bacterium]|nr:hypothetical protein [Ignavibacteriota bacterium]MCW5885475.1 hypothetical protein [Candidatus Kapabacteria bacterium]
MAKAQSFGDKLKKKKAESKPVVKVIKGFKGSDGSIRFVEQFMKVDDINEVDKIDIK